VSQSLSAGVRAPPARTQREGGARAGHLADVAADMDKDDRHQCDHHRRHLLAPNLERVAQATTDDGQPRVVVTPAWVASAKSVEEEDGVYHRYPARIKMCRPRAVGIVLSACMSAYLRAAGMRREGEGNPAVSARTWWFQPGAQLFSSCIIITTPCCTSESYAVVQSLLPPLPLACSCRGWRTVISSSRLE
jgi:hypothetical protein